MGPQERKLLLFAIMAGLLVLVRIFGKRLTNYLNAKEQQDEANKNIIRQPLFYLLVGQIVLFGSIALFTFIMIAPSVDNLNRALPAILLMIFILGGEAIAGLFFVFFRLNWRVEIQEDGFTYRNIFRSTKHYSFDEIMEKYTGKTYRYYKGKKKILTISALQPNCFLLSQAFSKWKKIKREEEKQKKAEERQRKAEERQKKAEEHKQQSKKPEELQNQKKTTE